MTREWESATVPTVDPPSGGLVLERLSKWLGLVAVAAYVVLFCVMWLPVLLAGNEGWLFLFPIFLLLWIPVELAAIASLVLAVVGLTSRHPRGGRSRSWLPVVLLAGFVLVSLPLLWFGVGPV